TRRGKQRTPSASVTGLFGIGAQKTIVPSTTMQVRTIRDSRVLPCGGFHLGSVHQRITRGVKTIAPTASPSHQVSQIVPKARGVPGPPRRRLDTPIVALTAVLPIPARAAMRKTSRDRSNARRPPA